ncbi:hypothetical protein SteCoe_7869 [Stentor coeruleus]|uniref:GAF domain-containing protein n=1 Tax=Stentor coeruleus TaxID=5963 RepID=A0A1R2CLJ1_9CILI|nr:hypothetical protein SteCoe_7869 [Stentor coeruleus]
MEKLSSSEQEYLMTHEIDKLFESMMESLVLEKPNDPRAFLAQHLTKQSLLSFQDICHLLEAFKQVSAATSPLSASIKIIDLVCSMLHCDRASLFLHDALHNLLRMVVGKEARGIVLAENSGFTWKVFKTRQIVNIQDAYSNPNFDASVDITTGYKTENMLGVPINDSQGNVIGVLLALNKHSGNFSKKDEAVLMQLSNQAGVIIKNAIYYQKAINNELKSKALLKFVRQINKDAPGQSLAFELVTKAKDLLQAETCNIFMVDYAGDMLVPIATDSPYDYRLPLSSGILGQCVKNAEIINIDHDDSRFSREFDEKFGYITETLLIVPIKIESRVVGLVQITNKQSDAMFGDVKIYSKFDDDDAELLITFNEILGKKLEKLFDSLGKKTNERDDPAVKFQSSFGKNKYKTQELPEGAIKESEEEDDVKI